MGQALPPANYFGIVTMRDELCEPNQADLENIRI